MSPQTPASSVPIEAHLLDVPGDLVRSLLDHARRTLPRPSSPEDLNLVYDSYVKGVNLVTQVLGSNDRIDDANNITTQRDRIAEELNELQQEHNATQQALQQAQQRANQLHDLNFVLASQLKQTPKTATISSKESKMSDPAMFDGSRDKLRPFLTKLRLKLSEPGAFRDEQAKLRYIVGRLEGLALNQVVNHVNADGVNFTNTEALIDHLNACFDDPDRTGTASRKLQTIRQGSREFSTYFAEFQQYALQLNWNPEAIRAALKNGLSSELESALITIEEPDDYASFVTLLTRIDSKMRAAKNKLSPRPAGPTGPKGYNNGYNKQGPPAATSGSAATTPSKPAHPTSTNSGYYGPAAMDLSSNKRKLTPEERMRRIAEGLCLYCGGAGHTAATCTNKSSRLRLAEASFLKATEPVTNQAADDIPNGINNKDEPKN